MAVEQTQIPDVLIYTPPIFKDDRGYFFESYNQAVFQKETGLDIQFIQDNQALSSKNVLRGLHFQFAPKAQTKLVRVIQGSIWDIAVDLRADSTTFGQWVGVELSDENRKQILVPKGFAHGYAVLSETAVVAYKCDELYDKTHESGIFYLDTNLAIDWKINLEEAIISDKDKILAAFDADKKYF